MKSDPRNLFMRPPARALSFADTLRKSLSLTLIAMMVGGVAGCGPKRLRTDFTGYEKTYAETSNRELLLNLARLENREPTYFFKIGTIQSTYKMAASLPTNASYALQSTNVTTGAATGGGSPTVSYENDPIFTFIPVNDDTNAKFLLQQIPPETFYILYEQGWRVDQLFRLMVDRIELTTSTPKSACEVITYRNLPPPVTAVSTGTQPERDQLYKNYKEGLTQYAAFLRISAVLYSLQKHGDLILSGTNTFVPYDSNSVLPDPDDKKDADNTADQNPPGAAKTGNSTPVAAVTPGDVNSLLTALLMEELQNEKKSGSQPADGKSASKAPAASDMINAWSKNAVWEKTEKGWVLGEKTFAPVFYLNHYTLPSAADKTASSGPVGPDIDAIENDIMPDDDMSVFRNQNSSDEQGPKNPQILVDNILHSLVNGFSISDPTSEEDSRIGPCPKDPSGSQLPSSHLVMRSLLGLMSAAAQEQAPFAALIQNNPTVQPGQQNPGAPELPFTAAIPASELQPLLLLTGESRAEEVQPIISVDYHGKNYRIADLKNQSTENQYWNRDVFRLINQLTSQVTVDISKFPLTTILQ